MLDRDRNLGNRTHANKCQPILGRARNKHTKSAAREKLEPRAGLFRVRGRAGDVHLLESEFGGEKGSKINKTGRIDDTGGRRINLQCFLHAFLILVSAFLPF